MKTSSIRPLLQLLALSAPGKKRSFPKVESETVFAMSDADASFDSFEEFLLSAAEDSIRVLLGRVEMEFPDAPELSDDQLRCLEELYQPLEDFAEWEVESSVAQDAESQWWQRLQLKSAACLEVFGWSQADDPGSIARSLMDKWLHG